MKKFKKALFVFALALTALLIYLAFWGALLPWNPWKPGYREIRLERAVLFTREPERLAPAYRQVEAFMEDAEKTFDFQYRKPVKIMVGYSDLRRRLFMPWSNAKAVSLEPGDVIYICANRIDADQGNHDEYLRHELTHALLQQNAGPWNSWTMRKDHWLQEGVAVYFGGPHYMTRDQMIEKFRAAHLTPSTKTHQLFDGSKSLQPDFKYIMWGDFVNYLVKLKGRPALQAFLHQYIDDPANLRRIFAVSFDRPLDQAAEEYAAAITKDPDRSPPAP